MNYRQDEYKKIKSENSRVNSLPIMQYERHMVTSNPSQCEQSKNSLATLSEVEFLSRAIVHISLCFTEEPQKSKGHVKHQVARQCDKV